jgi:hypothetical protein
MSRARIRMAQGLSGSMVGYSPVDGSLIGPSTVTYNAAYQALKRFSLISSNVSSFAVNTAGGIGKY